MKEHIKSLIPSLSKYSQKLDKIASFTNKKWVFIDEEDNHQSYIFKKDGKLIMSLGGKVKVGAWEYLPEAESILIDRIDDKILLNHAFFDKAVLILKYDGRSNKDFFVLADANEIPDLDVLKYLESKKYEEIRNNADRKTVLQVEGDFELDIYSDYNSSFIERGGLVLLEGSCPKDGNYRSKSGKYDITIESGRIVEYCYTYKFKLRNQSLILVRTKNSELIRKGDLAFDQDGNPALSGKYKYGFMKCITIKDGRFVKHSFW